MRIALTVLGVLAGLVALNFVPIVSLRTPGMTETVSYGISVFATEDDQAEVDGIAERIALSRDRVLEALETEASEGIEVIIYPSQAALRRKTLGLAGMLLLPDWFIGRNTRNTVLIVSPASPGPQHSRESVTQAAVHEYVHVLTDRRNKQLGYWLKEGIALYLAEQIPSLGSIRAERDITYEEFSRPNVIQFANVGGYTLAYTLIGYLEEAYGWDSVIDLTEQGASYDSVLGKDRRALFDEWTAYLMTL